MKGKRIKQINNLVIYQDTHEKIRVFDDIEDNPFFGKCSVWAPDGRCLEARMTMEQAEAFCHETKDFVQKSRLDYQITAAEGMRKEINTSDKTPTKENEL